MGPAAQPQGNSDELDQRGESHTRDPEGHLLQPAGEPVTPETVTGLHDAVTRLANDADPKVVVFSSGTPGYFFNHFDLSQAADFPVLPDGTPAWVDLVLALSKAPFISIAAIRGRTRGGGGGDELALACDLRYASREHARFGQPEVGTGILPGGGGSERLPRLAGRDRALEAILTSYDYDADTAERYGWVTRTMPDADLDAFVDRISARLAACDKQALTAAKAQVNRATLPPEADLHAAYAEYWDSLSWPGFQVRMPLLAKYAAEHGLGREPGPPGRSQPAAIEPLSPHIPPRRSHMKAFLVERYRDASVHAAGTNQLDLKTRAGEFKVVITMT